MKVLMILIKAIILPKYRQCLIIISGLLLSGILNASNITNFTLNNGLKVIVKEDHRAPVFIVQIWYGVGASHETLGITGISHLLEHMMFKGTKQYKAGEFSKIIAKNGGQDNAFTSKDYTAYYQKMGKDKLSVALKLEADRLQNLQLKESDFESERQVVVEERRLRIEDKPIAQLYEKLRQITFDKKGSYHYPVIGLMKDIQTMPLSALLHWYKTYYQPNNAVIVVVGDVNPNEVQTLVKQYFANIPSTTLNKHNKPSYPILAQKASLTLHAQLPYGVLAFSVPSLAVHKNQTDAYALEIISYILNNNDNAWLNKALIRDKLLASSVSVYYSLYDQYQTNFIISFTPADGISIDEVKAEIWRQISRLKTELISQKILGNIQTQAQASYIYEQDSIDTQAYYLGALETIGLGYQTAGEYAGKIHQISAEQIQAIAKKYFTKQNLSSIRLIPK